MADRFDKEPFDQPFSVWVGWIGLLAGLGCEGWQIITYAQHTELTHSVMMVPETQWERGE